VREKRVNGKLVWLVTVLVLASVHLAEAQQPTGKVPRIGYLAAGSPSLSSFNREAFQQGLSSLGYVEGKNILIEYRYAETRLERVPELAEELVRLKVDVLLVAGGTNTARQVKKVTNSIPIVFTEPGDPVGAGLVVSLARPGGNLTGVSSVSRDLVGKRLELLKETLPNLSRVAVLFNPDSSSNVAGFKEMDAHARLIGLQLQALEVRDAGGFEDAIRSATRGKAGGLLVLSNSILNAGRKQIAELAINHRLPAMFATSRHMDAGGLMSYGPDYADLYRRAAIYVDKILKGAKPADLPVERPTKFEFVINLKTAKQIGLTIPPNVLARADKVIR
jgi:putative ABC transport system substrate-binding protein